MKQIFDWLREQMEEKSVQGFDGNGNPVNVRFVVSIMAEDIITEAEAKWKEKEAELRASVIDEFAEKCKEKWIDAWDLNLFSAFIEFVDEIASQMKGEKE